MRSLLRSWPARSLRVLYAFFFLRNFTPFFTYPLRAFFTPIRHHVFFNRVFNAFFLTRVFFFPRTPLLV